MRAPSWPYLIVVSFISSVLTAMLVAGIAVKLTERKFCDLLILLDEGYNAPVRADSPPLSERGARIAAATHKLRASLGCD